MTIHASRVREAMQAAYFLASQGASVASEVAIEAGRGDQRPFKGGDRAGHVVVGQRLRLPGNAAAKARR